MMGLSTSQRHAKFEVVSFSCCTNIKKAPQILGSSFAQGYAHFFLWLWFYDGSWQSPAACQIWSRGLHLLRTYKAIHVCFKRLIHFLSHSLGSWGKRTYFIYSSLESAWSTSYSRQLNCFPSSYGWDVISRYRSKSAFFKKGGSLWPQILGRRGPRPQPLSVSEN